MLGAIVGAVGEVAGQWLGNRKAKASAKAKLQLAQFEAEAERVGRKMDIDLEQLRQTATLDTLAIRQANKSWFDEFLALILLLPGILSAAGACLGAPPELWGKTIFAALDETPLWYQLALGLLMVHYFGFRSLLRLYLNGKFNMPAKRKEKENDKEESN